MRGLSRPGEFSRLIEIAALPEKSLIGAPVRKIRNNFLNRLGGQIPTVLQVKGREATERAASRLEIQPAALDSQKLKGDATHIIVEDLGADR